MSTTVDKIAKELEENKTAKELLEIATSMQIVGRHKMPKPLLARCIAEVKNQMLKAETKLLKEQESQDVKEEVTTEKIVAEANVQVEKKFARQEARKQTKEKYICNMQIGTIVAFRLPSGKVISAAVEKRSIERRALLLRTKYGAEHRASFDDVVWVRTSKSWPKQVYFLLKGVDGDQVEKKQSDLDVQEEQGVAGNIQTAENEMQDGASYNESVFDDSKTECLPL